MPARSRRVHVAEPSERGLLDGLSYVMYLPDGPPAGAVVVLHGAGSRKENHLEFTRACRHAGMVALAADMRGHGASEGAMDGRALDDVALLAAHARAAAGGAPVALRGASMGGWLAICAARQAGAAAVVAICAASSEGLRRGLVAGRFDLRADVESLTALLVANDELQAAAALGIPLLLLHAAGDEVVPASHSEALHAAAPGSRLVVVPGGHHRTAQHDPELQDFSVRWLARRLGEAGA